MNSDKHQDYDTIYPIAFVLYENFTTSKKIIRMATLMIDNVLIYNAQHYFERGVMASLSYFIDNNFKVAITQNGLNDPNLIPAVPPNWRDAISTVNNPLIGTENWIATFLVRKNTQTFELQLSSHCCIGSTSGSIGIVLIHCGNHRGFTLELHSSEVNGIGEANRSLATAFGAHVIKKFLKAWDGPMKRASKDQAPSTPASPV